MLNQTVFRPAGWRPCRVAWSIARQLSLWITHFRCFFWAWIEQELLCSWLFSKRKAKCTCTFGSRTLNILRVCIHAAESSCACLIFCHEKFADPTRCDTNFRAQKLNEMIMLSLCITSSTVQHVLSSVWLKHTQSVSVLVAVFKEEGHWTSLCRCSSNCMTWLGGFGKVCAHTPTALLSLTRCERVYPFYP